MTLLTSVFLAAALLSLFIAISLLSTRALKPQSARILGANYLLFSIQNLLAVLIFSEIWSQAVVIRASLAMMVGPALFFYFKCVLAPEGSKASASWLHLVPVPMVFVLLLMGGYLVDIFIIGSFLGYFSYTLIQYLKTASNTALLTRSKDRVGRWLGVLLCLMLLNLIVDLGVVFEVNLGIPVRHSVSLKIGSLMFMGFHLFALVLVLTRAPLLDWMHELKEVSTQKPNSAQLDDQELQTIYCKWEALVRTKESFILENGITVSRAAKLLGLPARQLSQAINRIYGASFSQYLNDKRVDRAKRLLCQNMNISVTEVYLAAGFGTKSHFHREFSRCTGMTPSAFRAQQNPSLQG